MADDFTSFDQGITVQPTDQFQGVGPDPSWMIGSGSEPGYVDPLAGMDTSAPSAPQYQPNSLGDIMGGANAIRSLLSLGSGIYGLSQGRDLANLGRQAIQSSNPFGPYRDRYAQQLNSLMADPSSVRKLPGYQFGMDQGETAVARKMAGTGYAGSGNEAIALDEFGQNYADQFYQQQVNILSGLSGANITPNPGPGLAGVGAGLGTQSAGLASVGYGATQGASAGTPGSYYPGSFGVGANLPPGYGGGVQGPSSAGGEAATAIGLGTSAINLVNSGERLMGGTPSPMATNLQGIGGDLSAGLGIYSGLERGGVSGDFQAGLGAAQLGENAGLISAGSAVGEAIPVLGAGFAVYNAVENWKPGATGQDALGGAEAGAAIGSIVPGIGTLIGAVIGGAVGALSSVFGGKDTSKENWQGFIAGGDKQDPSKIDPTGLMWTLGGLWRSGDQNFPGIKNFSDGNKFSTAMANQIAMAVKAGKISSSTPPDTVLSTVVGPWLASLPGGSNWGKSGVAGAEASVVRGLVYNYMSGKPITWGETQSGKPEYPYASLKSLTTPAKPSPVAVKAAQPPPQIGVGNRSTIGTPIRGVI